MGHSQIAFGCKEDKLEQRDIVSMEVRALVLGDF